MEQIVGSPIINYVLDCLDLERLRDVFRKHTIHAIIHCAALKSVDESMEKPVLYYRINIGILVNLLTVRFFSHITYTLIITFRFRLL